MYRLSSLKKEEEIFYLVSQVFETVSILDWLTDDAPFSSYQGWPSSTVSDIWNSFNIGRTDDAPFSSFQGWPSSASSFYVSLLQVINAVASLALCPQPLNPFAAPACKISGLQAHGHPCEQSYFLAVYHIYFRCYAFSGQSFHMPVQKEKRKG